MSEFRRNLLTAMNRVEPPITKDYLTIVALEDGLTAKLSLNACEYCVDGNGNWKTLPADTETETVNTGQTLSFRGNLSPDSTNGIGTFTVNRLHNLKGNCMSMLFGDEGKNRFSLIGKYASFIGLFKNDVGLVNACEFKLPATTLIDSCYRSMFANCTNIITAPELPAITLKPYCYYTMFSQCSSLINTPQLLATTLANSCYFYMFNNCLSIVESPELPATTLANSCYGGMFTNCTNLTNVSNLPATTLEGACYAYMFDGCSNLTKAPILPAVILVNGCYNFMFQRCSNLSYIKMLATDISATNCMGNWVNSVASKGIFVKNKDATWNFRGISGIPSGWEVITE